MKQVAGICLLISLGLAAAGFWLSMQASADAFRLCAQYAGQEEWARCAAAPDASYKFWKAVYEISAVAMVVSLLVVLLVSAQENRRRRCPVCKEMVLWEALKCRYCGSEVPGPTTKT